MDRTRLVGDAITATGVLHTAFGLIGLRAPLVGMIDDGWVASLTSDDRAAAFWYFLAGGFLVVTGLSIRRLRRDGARVPAVLGVGLAALAVFGILAAPSSGFWLVLIEGVGLVWFGRDRRTGRHAHA